MAQSVGHPTLDFAWGGDLRVMRSGPAMGSTPGMEPAWDSTSALPCLPPPHILSHKKIKKRKTLMSTTKWQLSECIPARLEIMRAP